MVEDGKGRRWEKGKMGKGEDGKRGKMGKGGSGKGKKMRKGGKRERGKTGQGENGKEGNTGKGRKRDRGETGIPGRLNGCPGLAVHGSNFIFIFKYQIRPVGGVELTGRAES
jgi:hypothetical protein